MSLLDLLFNAYMTVVV